MSRQAVFFDAPRRVALRTEDCPRPAADEVLVATELSAVSSGTELLIYRGEAPSDLAADDELPALAGALRFPLKYGYSAVGEVAEVGPEVDPAWLGRRVFAFQPHHDRFVSRTSDLHPLPAGITAEDAVFLPNMETAVNFLMDGGPLVGEQVVVFGQGTVGLLTTALLASFPLACLVTADRYPRRREASRKLGAGACLDPGAADFEDRLAEALAGEGSAPGADLVYELSGNPAALGQAVAAAGFDGRVVIGSWYGGQRVCLDLGGRFHRSRVRLVSSQVSTLAPRWGGRWSKLRRLAVAWEMIRRLRPSRLITHRPALSEAAAAYDLLDRRPQDVIQVVFRHRQR